MSVLVQYQVEVVRINKSFPFNTPCVAAEIGLQDKLSEGWEPFAATQTEYGTDVWLRRKVVIQRRCASHKGAQK